MPATAEEVGETGTETAPVETQQQTAERLIKNCSRVRVRYSWFSTSSKVDDAIAAEMLVGTDADKKAVSISKKLLKSKHPAMYAAKESMQAIKNYVSSMTIPYVAVALASSAADARSLAAKKDPGYRLIQKEDMATFDEHMEYLRTVLRTAAEALNEALPEIKAADRERLGRLYKESDYPAGNLADMISVLWNYESTAVDLDWQALCPAIYEREQSLARQRFEAVVENAATEFATRFVKYVKQVTDQLGNRLRLNPLKGKNRLPAVGADGEDIEVNVMDAEVMTKLTHEDDEDQIPKGHVLLEVRLKKSDKGKSQTVWLHAIPEQRFRAELQPFETSEKRKLYASTLDNLKAELETFVNIGSMLGPYQSIIEDSVQKVKDLVTRGDTEKVVQELRDGTFFREELKEALEGVAHRVSSSVGDAMHSRRTFNRRLIGKV
jgi:hypothetical protein